MDKLRFEVDYWLDGPSAFRLPRNNDKGDRVAGIDWPGSLVVDLLAVRIHHWFGDY